MFDNFLAMADNSSESFALMCSNIKHVQLLHGNDGNMPELIVVWQKVCPAGVFYFAHKFKVCVRLVSQNSL